MSYLPGNSLYPPIKPGTASYTESKNWLRVHINDIRRFMYQRNRFSTLQDFARSLNGNISLGYEVVYDYIVPNHVKTSWVKDFVRSGSNIILVLGIRGGGKTATSYWFLEEYYNAGVQPCLLGPPQKHPEEFIRVSSLRDVPPGSVVFPDELGVRFNSRNSGGKERVAELSILPVLRHMDISVVAASQLSALGDLNFMRLADMVVLKPMGLFGNSLERDVIRQFVPDIYMPQTKEISHVFCNEFRCNAELGLSQRFWDEEYSTPYRVLEPDEVMGYLRELFSDGMKDEQILDEIILRSRNMSQEEIKDLLNAIKKE